MQKIVFLVMCIFYFVNKIYLSVDTRFSKNCSKLPPTTIVAAPNASAHKMYSPGAL